MSLKVLDLNELHTRSKEPMVIHFLLLDYVRMNINIDMQVVEAEEVGYSQGEVDA